MSAGVVQALGGISSVIGLASLAAYCLLRLQTHTAETSIRRLVEEEGLFNAAQVLSILSQFGDDNARLDALKVLANYDGTKAAALLKKVKANVDLRKLDEGRTRDRQHRLIVTGVLFLCLAVVSLLSTRLRPVPEGKDGSGQTTSTSSSGDIETRERMYRHALSTRLRADYIDFLERYPSGQMSDDVQRRLEACSKYEATKEHISSHDDRNMDAREDVLGFDGTPDEYLARLNITLPLDACKKKGLDEGKGECTWVRDDKTAVVHNGSIFFTAVSCRYDCYSLKNKKVELEACPG